MLLKLQLLLLECFSFRPWHCSQYLLLRKKKTLKSQHHSGFLWAAFLWKCRWQKSSLFPSVDLWFVRSWSRILQFLLGPNWPPWLALCKEVFRYGHTTVSDMNVTVDFDLFNLGRPKVCTFWEDHNISQNFVAFSEYMNFNNYTDFAIFVLRLKCAIGQTSESCLILRLFQEAKNP